MDNNESYMQFLNKNSAKAFNKIIEYIMNYSKSTEEAAELLKHLDCWYWAFKQNINE